MNFRLVLRALGQIQMLMALSMLPVPLWSLHFGDGDHVAMLTSAAITGALGALLWLIGRRAPREFYRREAILVVTLGWMLTAATGALPFIFAEMLSPLDALFESVSGFTTTGSTVITDIDRHTDPSHPAAALRRGVMFWRSETHWLGGIGIIALLVVLLPAAGGESKSLYRSEASGLAFEALKPRIKQTVARLVAIYVLLTGAQTLLLLVCGLSLYDALSNAFATISTGGFSPRGASVAAYGSLRVELVITAFMYLGAVNFYLHYRLLHGQFGAVLRDREWQTFTLLLLIAIGLMTLDVFAHSPAAGLGAALRGVAFSVTSVFSCTGFTTVDFDTWPDFSRAGLLVLMVMGGCAGSTAGGLKIIRLVLLWKIAKRELRRNTSPRRVEALRLGERLIDDETTQAVLVFFWVFIGLFATASLAMLATGLDFISAVSSVAATMSNVGPGLGAVGAVEPYAALSAVAKVILMFTMLAGRLELWAVFCLFAPSFWQTRRV